MSLPRSSRRRFLRLGAACAATAALRVDWACAGITGRTAQRDARVALTRCRGYGPEVRAALERSFDLLGGLGARVKGRTVTVKVNLTGTNFTAFKGRPPGETFMTHYATALALAGLLCEAGARRVRFVESTNSRAPLEQTLVLAGWDVNALQASGRVEFENTRNLGSSSSYQTLRVPGGGLMFSSFELNRVYHDTDVFVSLAKLKNHLLTGVTLSLKNLFGITPNALYSAQAGREDATAGREVLHTPRGHREIQLPGLKPSITSEDAGWRVPRIIADLCGARPVDLAIVDGITAMRQGEGPWSDFDGAVTPIAPGLLLVGFDPVATDAVGTAVMGYDDPRALRGTEPFVTADNHLWLAEQAGLGTADLKRIEVLGLNLEEARCPYGHLAR